MMAIGGRGGGRKRLLFFGVVCYRQGRYFDSLSLRRRPNPKMFSVSAWACRFLFLLIWIQRTSFRRRNTFFVPSYFFPPRLRLFWSNATLWRSKYPYRSYRRMRCRSRRTRWRSSIAPGTYLSFLHCRHWLWRDPFWRLRFLSCEERLCLRSYGTISFVVSTRREARRNAVQWCLQDRRIVKTSVRTYFSLVETLPVSNRPRSEWPNSDFFDSYELWTRPSYCYCSWFESVLPDCLPIHRSHRSGLWKGERCVRVRVCVWERVRERESKRGAAQERKSGGVFDIEIWMGSPSLPRPLSLEYRRRFVCSMSLPHQHEIRSNDVIKKNVTAYVRRPYSLSLSFTVPPLAVYVRSKVMNLGSTRMGFFNFRIWVWSPSICATLFGSSVIIFVVFVVFISFVCWFVFEVPEPK